MEKQKLLNIYVNNVDMEEVVQYIVDMVEMKQKSYIVPVNVDVIMKIENDIYLRKIVNEADMVLTDGQPLVWIAKWSKKNIKSKISGSDLVPKLCEIASQKGYRIFIIGGKDGVAEKAKKNLEVMYKGIKVVGTYAPVLGFEKDENELGKINQMINEACPDILIACFGCPKQEKWIYENYKKYNANVSICAGATVDFLAGTVKRAPKWMSDHGLEWFYRFLKEPKRLFKRYFVDDIQVIKLFFKYR